MRGPLKIIPDNSEIRKRFESKLIKGKQNECWAMNLKPHPLGYYKIKFKCQGYFAHRVSWGVFNGKMPPSDKIICHKCDNPLCVNPAHLFLGTDKDNFWDAIKKKRRKINYFKNKRKKVCIYGHPLNKQNTYETIRKSGPRIGSLLRRCKICHSRRSKIHKQTAKQKKRECI